MRVSHDTESSNDAPVSIDDEPVDRLEPAAPEDKTRPPARQVLHDDGPPPAPARAEDDDDDDATPAPAADGAPPRLSRRQLEKNLADAEARNAAGAAQTRKLLDDHARLRTQFEQAGPRVQSTERQLVEARIASKDAELVRYRKEMADALEVGDTSGYVEVLTKHNDAQFEANALKYTRQRMEQQQPKPTAAPVQPAAQPQQPSAQRPSPAAVAWAERNQWFGKDDAKTGAAYAVDATLKREGYAVDSPAYYRELDSRIAAAFPDTGGTRRPSAVAGVPGPARSRLTRSPQLTEREQAIARKLGVTYEQYAAHRK
jgi:hypothetical protein